MAPNNYFSRSKLKCRKHREPAVTYRIIKYHILVSDVSDVYNVFNESWVITAVNTRWKDVVPISGSELSAFFVNTPKYECLFIHICVCVCVCVSLYLSKSMYVIRILTKNAVFINPNVKTEKEKKNE